MAISPILYQDNQTLIALACLTHTKIDKSTQNQLQKKAVRHLLSLCMAEKFNGYQLQETCYPYQLTQINNRPFFICFSHSGNRLALIVSPTPCGIDIEIRSISHRIAKRFFHPNELDYIASTPTHQQSDVRCLLWQIKESMVKLTGSTLSQLISQDMTEYAHTLIKSDTHQWIKHTSTTNTDYLLWHAHQIVAIQAIQTA